jgi:hypothetical protein
MALFNYQYLKIVSTMYRNSTFYVTPTLLIALQKPKPTDGPKFISKGVRGKERKNETTKFFRFKPHGIPAS